MPWLGWYIVELFEAPCWYNFSHIIGGSLYILWEVEINKGLADNCRWGYHYKHHKYFWQHFYIYWSPYICYFGCYGIFYENRNEASLTDVKVFYIKSIMWSPLRVMFATILFDESLCTHFRGCWWKLKNAFILDTNLKNLRVFKKYELLLSYWHQ